jgi:hypothetical protein
MEPPRTLLKRILDSVDLHFDTWWRKHMTKLMEIDRTKKELQEWLGKKREHPTPKGE